MVKKISRIQLFLLFGIPGLLMYIACKIAIPFLNSFRVFPIEISWFLSAGFLVLIPIFIASLIFVKNEIKTSNLQAMFARMRIKPMQPVDWAYAVGALVLIIGLTLVLAKVSRAIPLFNSAPDFMADMPLKPGQSWILLAWLPFFFFNIFGEEFWWRGYILPKQELLTKQYTWIVHGILWTLFHVGIGWSAVVLALPIFYILPLVMQIRENTTISIIIHTTLGAFGFLTVALGLIK